jgi:hypothetical protein
VSLGFAGQDRQSGPGFVQFRQPDLTDCRTGHVKPFERAEGGEQNYGVISYTPAAFQVELFEFR